jgi:hypothetical protein
MSLDRKNDKKNTKTKKYARKLTGTVITNGSILLLTTPNLQEQQSSDGHNKLQISSHYPSRVRPRR